MQRDHFKGHAQALPADLMRAARVTKLGLASTMCMMVVLQRLTGCLVAGTSMGEAPTVAGLLAGPAGAGLGIEAGLLAEAAGAGLLGEAAGAGLLVTGVGAGLIAGNTGAGLMAGDTGAGLMAGDAGAASAVGDAEG